MPLNRFGVRYDGYLANGKKFDSWQVGLAPAGIPGATPAHPAPHGSPSSCHWPRCASKCAGRANTVDRWTPVRRRAKASFRPSLGRTRRRCCPGGKRLSRR
eukprot:scaffold8477_cov112-Isochrysis_galbana.AAC.4